MVGLTVPRSEKIGVQLFGLLGRMEHEDDGSAGRLSKLIANRPECLQEIVLLFCSGIEDLKRSLASVVTEDHSLWWSPANGTVSHHLRDRERDVVSIHVALSLIAEHPTRLKP